MAFDLAFKVLISNANLLRALDFYEIAWIGQAALDEIFVLIFLENDARIDHRLDRRFCLRVSEYEKLYRVSYLIG